MSDENSNVVRFGNNSKPVQERLKIRRLNQRAQDALRAKIRADIILTRFQAFANDTTVSVTDGSTGIVSQAKVFLTPDQIRVGEILLRKVMPDLKQVEIQRDVDLGKVAARATRVAAEGIAGAAGASEASSEYGALMGLGAA